MIGIKSGCLDILAKSLGYFVLFALLIGCLVSTSYVLYKLGDFL